MFVRTVVYFFYKLPKVTRGGNDRYEYSVLLQNSVKFIGTKRSKYGYNGIRTGSLYGELISTCNRELYSGVGALAFAVEAL